MGLYRDSFFKGSIQVLVFCGEDYVTSPVLLAKYQSGDQIKRNEMGKTCSTCGGEVNTGF